MKKQRLEHRVTLLSEWPRTLLDGLVPFKKPQLLNGKELANAIETKMIDLTHQPVYCGVFFMKAGRQHIVVRHENQTYVQKDLIKYREDDVESLF